MDLMFRGEGRIYGFSWDFTLFLMVGMYITFFLIVRDGYTFFLNVRYVFTFFWQFKWHLSWILFFSRGTGFVFFLESSKRLRGGITIFLRGKDGFKFPFLWVQNSTWTDLCFLWGEVQFTFSLRDTGGYTSYFWSEGRIHFFDCSKWHTGRFTLLLRRRTILHFFFFGSSKRHIGGFNCFLRRRDGITFYFLTFQISTWTA